MIFYILCICSVFRGQKIYSELLPLNSTNLDYMLLMALFLVFMALIFIWQVIILKTIIHLFHELLIKRKNSSSRFSSNYEAFTTTCIVVCLTYSSFKHMRGVNSFRNVRDWLIRQTFRALNILVLR